MKWTNIISTAAKVFLILGIIGSLAGGIAFAHNIFWNYDEIEIFLYGILFAAIGIVAILISYAMIMMLCEISQNLYETKQEVQKVNSKLDEPAKNTPREMPSYSGVPSQNKPRAGLFIDSDTSNNNSDTTNKWKCPKCGKENKNSTRVCMDCAYQR